MIRRAAAGGPRADTVAFLMVAFWAASTLYNIYPLEAGLLRRRRRRDRRPALGLENPWLFYPREAARFVTSHTRIAIKLARVWWFLRAAIRDPDATAYTDEALRPSDGAEGREIARRSEQARAAAAMAKRNEARSRESAAEAAR